LVDDASGLTLAAASDVSTANDKKTKVERASVVGEAIAKKAIEKKIQEVVFDRGGFLYAGRVKALAESARKAGLTF
jgi:large subunit ribosomal protein L18